MRSIRKTRNSLENNGLALLYFLAICLLLAPACDCTSSDSSGDAKSDDDLVIDDDSLNDDADDDAGTTTTTSPTTTTTTAPPTSSSTTTTVVTTTTTTTTSTMNPGTGTACDPFNKIPTVVDRAKPFGPWPEFEERGITFRQIIASGAGQGLNDILFTSDGLARVAAQDGRSLDVIAVGTAGEVSREVVDPRGGEWKVLGRDTDDRLYLLYTVHVDQSPETWEVRAATNKSGSWERETLFTSNDDGNLSLDMAVDAAGLMHMVYCGRDDSAAMFYATWDGDTYTESQIAASPGSWRYTYALALDSAGSPHALVSEPSGMWHWRIEEGVWTGDLATANAFAWDLEIDANDVLHAGMAANGGHLVYGKLESGTWTFEDLDDCQDGVSFISVNADGAGHVHIAYTNGDQDDVLYATNASGAWVHTFLYEENTEFDFGHALDMASALDEDGKLHIVHRRYNDYDSARDSDLNLSTNETGTWVRKRLIKGSALNFSPGVIGSDDRIHLAFQREFGDRLVYGVLDGDAWDEETVEAITGTGTIAGTPAVQLSPDGIPHVLYATSAGENHEIDEMKFAARDDRGWDVETITDDAAGYAFGVLAFDSTGRSHVTFSEAETELAPWEAVYGWKDDQWNLEMIGDVRKAHSLMLDPDDAPVISFQIDAPPLEKLLISKREWANNWVDDTILSTEGNLFHAISTIRDDGTIDLFSSASGDPILPHSAIYATNYEGNWVIESLGIFGGNDAMIVDEENHVHYLLYASGGSPPPDPVGVYYLTNMTGSWERHLVYFGGHATEPLSIQINTQGKLTAAFDTGNSLLTATFNPGMEP